MKVLLIGASGRTGRLIAARLSGAGHTGRALYRREASRPFFDSVHAESAVYDLKDDFSAAFSGMDAVIYAAGSAESEGPEEERLADRDAVARTADYAKAHGLRRIVVISSISAYDPQSYPPLFHYSQMKKEGDEYVLASGLDSIILRPGSLSDGTATGRISTTVEWPSPRAVSRADLAEVAVQALLAGGRGRILGFVGGETPIAEALREV